MTCANTAAPLGLSLQNVTVSEDGHAVARGIAVGVGHPQQILSLRPSIGDGNTWAFNAADCINSRNSSCIGSKGGVFNSSLSHDYAQSTEAAWNGTHQSQESGQYIYFNDDFHFGSNGSVTGFPFLMDQPGQGTQGGLGIGPQSTFLEAAVKSGSAPSRAFGLWAGSRSIQNPADGSLWIGGYDTSRVIGEFTSFPTYNQCPSCVKVTNITYVSNKGSTSLFSNSTEALNVALEPFEKTLQVTSDIFENFLRASGGVVGTDYGTTGLVTVSPNAGLGNLSVTLGNGYTTVIPASELFLPPRGYDSNGFYSISNSTYLVGGLANITVDPSYVLSWGVPFFTMNYMIMDYDNQTFSLAPAQQGQYGVSNGPLIKPLCKGIAPVTTTPVGTPGATGTPTTSPTPSPGKHTNVGAIAGGVVGGVVGLALVGALIFFFLRGRKREDKLRRERDSVIASTVMTQAKHDSQYTTRTPTSVSDGGVGELEHHAVSRPFSPDRGYSQEQPHTGTLREPFEMPAPTHDPDRY